MTSPTLNFSNKHKHLEFIQAAVTRLAGNSFLLKGWTVTLIAALFALAAKDANKRYMIIAYFPLVIFYFLDAYFLAQERLFRALYDNVRVRDEHAIDFSMKPASNEPFFVSWLGAWVSPTLLCFYVGLALILTILMIRV